MPEELLFELLTEDISLSLSAELFTELYLELLCEWLPDLLHGLLLTELFTDLLADFLFTIFTELDGIGQTGRLGEGSGDDRKVRRDYVDACGSGQKRHTIVSCQHVQCGDVERRGWVW